jgi:hypothetical protein
MSFYEVMIGLCLGGFALSIIYCIAEYRHWALRQAADRQNALTIRAIYAKLLSVQTIHRAALELVVRPLTTLTGRKGK